MKFTKNQKIMINFLIAKKLQQEMGVNIEGCLLVNTISKHQTIGIITIDNRYFCDIGKKLQEEPIIKNLKKNPIKTIGLHNQLVSRSTRHATDDEINTWVLDNIK